MGKSWGLGEQGAISLGVGKIRLGDDDIGDVERKLEGFLVGGRNRLRRVVCGDSGEVTDSPALVAGGPNIEWVSEAESPEARFVSIHRSQHRDRHLDYSRNTRRGSGGHGDGEGVGGALTIALGESIEQSDAVGEVAVDRADRRASEL